MIASTSLVLLLSYCIEKGKTISDPERLLPLKNLEMPTDMKSLKLALSLFSYYSQWIPKFSKIIHPLVICKEIPLQANRAESFLAEESLIGTQ